MSERESLCPVGGGIISGEPEETPAEPAGRLHLGEGERITEVSWNCETGKIDVVLTTWYGEGSIRITPVADIDGSQLTWSPIIDELLGGLRVEVTQADIITDLAAIAADWKEKSQTGLDFLLKDED